MIYRGTGRNEQEVLLRLDRLDGQAHINSTWPEWSRKLERLYGAPKKVTQREGKVTSAFWTIPLNRVTLRRGPRRVAVSEAQREAAREQMRQLHQKRRLAGSKA